MTKKTTAKGAEQRRWSEGDYLDLAMRQHRIAVAARDFAGLGISPEIVESYVSAQVGIDWIPALVEHGISPADVAASGKHPRILLVEAGDQKTAHRIARRIARRGRPRSGGRVSLGVAVPPNVRAQLETAAAALGVSMADYISNVIAEPTRVYDTAPLQIAKPLTTVGYHVARAIAALEREQPDVTAALDALRQARNTIAAELAPLRRRHERGIAENDDRLMGGWSDE